VQLILVTQELGPPSDSESPGFWGGKGGSPFPDSPESENGRAGESGNGRETGNPRFPIRPRTGIGVLSLWGSGPVALQVGDGPTSTCGACRGRQWAGRTIYNGPLSTERMGRLGASVLLDGICGCSADSALRLEPEDEGLPGHFPLKPSACFPTRGEPSRSRCGRGKLSEGISVPLTPSARRPTRTRSSQVCRACLRPCGSIASPWHEAPPVITREHTRHVLAGRWVGLRRAAGPHSRESRAHAASDACAQGAG
jgi:hypothetical protein